MLIVFLVVLLGDFPFLMFGKLATFDNMHECRAYMAKAPERLRGKLECLQILRPTELEASKSKEDDHG